MLVVVRALSLVLIAAVSVSTTAFPLLDPHCLKNAYTNTLQLAHMATSLNSKKNSFDDSVYGPFEEGYAKISREDNPKPFSLYYRIYNKDDTRSKIPLVVLHGGPSLPSQYLYPMVSNLRSDRAIIFYDQLGCGKSDEPKNKKFYSIEQGVEDLDIFLQSLGYGHDRKVHLFGHSYGGCLAFEYAKANPQKLQSLTLSNTPVNMKAAGDEYDQLALRNPLGFWKQHVCSVESPALDNALLHVGRVWAGMDVVLDYKAKLAADQSFFPNTLVLSCSRDFVRKSSLEWRSVLQGVDVEEIILDTCAHYPHLEDGEKFGQAVDAFLSNNDKQSIVRTSLMGHSSRLSNEDIEQVKRVP